MCRYAAALASAVYFAPRAEHLLARARRVLTLHRIVIGLTLLLLVIPILQGLGFDAPMSRAWTTFWHRLDRATELETSESFRIAQYRTTANVLRDHPLLGLGFGTFTRQFQEYKHPSTPSGYIATTTENMYLMTASETGLLGLLAFLALLFALIRSLYQNYKATPPGAARDLHLAALAAVCGFLLNMLTWDALNEPTVRITFWMLVGIGLTRWNVKTLQR